MRPSTTCWEMTQKKGLHVIFHESHSLVACSKWAHLRALLACADVQVEDCV